QPVLAAERDPCRLADAVRERLALAAERRYEAARGQLQRADRLERMPGQQFLERGQVQRGGEAEHREVAEEHLRDRVGEGGVDRERGGAPAPCRCGRRGGG